MQKTHLPEFMSALCEKYGEHRLRFESNENAPGRLIGKIGHWRCQPIKLKIDITSQSGAVESIYDFEFFQNGTAECGTMWDESDDERSRIQMTFEDWVAGQVEEMVDRHVEWLKEEG